MYGFKPERIDIETIGAKPGEKLYEELMSQEEIRRAVELKDYFSVLPAFRGVYHDIDYDYPDVVTGEVTKPYISAEENPMTISEIRKFLRENDLLGTPAVSSDFHSIPRKEEH